MATQHPKQRRPDPGHLKPFIESFAFSIRAGGLSARTATIYTDAIGLFAGWLRYHYGQIEWDQVGRDHLRRFFVWLQDSAELADGPCPHWLPPKGGTGTETAAPDRPSCAGYGKGYVNNLARCLQQFSTWLADEEDLPPMFDRRVKVPPAPKPGENPVPVLSKEELASLIRDAERTRRFEDRRDAAILHLFRSTGIRLAELAGVDLDDVDLSERTADVIGKGGKRRTVRFDHETVRALDRYKRVRARHPSAHLPALWLGVRRKQRMTPSGIYQMIAGRGARLGIKVHPHMFRHGFVDAWLDNGGEEGDLMELTGWESTQMLQRYGRAVRSRRAQRSYDRVMGGV